MLGRRALLRSFVGIIAAPAIVRVSALMPVCELPVAPVNMALLADMLHPMRLKIWSRQLLFDAYVALPDTFGKAIGEEHA